MIKRIPTKNDKHFQDLYQEFKKRGYEVVASGYTAYFQKGNRLIILERKDEEDKK